MRMEQADQPLDRGDAAWTAETDDHIEDYGAGISPDGDQPDIDDDYGTEEPIVVDEDDEVDGSRAVIDRDEPSHAEPVRKPAGVTPPQHERAYEEPPGARGEHQDAAGAPQTAARTYAYAAPSAPDRVRERPVRRPEAEVSDAPVVQAEARVNFRERHGEGTGTFGEVLSADEDPQTNFIGGNVLDREAAVFHAVAQDMREIRAQQMSGQRREDVTIVVADFNPAEEESLFAQAAVPEFYESEVETVAGNDGFLSRLYADELVDSLARAAAGDDQAARRAFARVLGPLAEALGEPGYDPALRQDRTMAPSLPILRDALVRSREGPRGADYSKLTEEQEDAVDMALNKPFKEKNSSALEQIGIFVEDLVESAEVAAARRGPQIRPAPVASSFSDKIPKLTVESIQVTDTTDSQGNVLAQALMHYIKATRPDGVVIKDADFAGDSAALNRLINECRKYGANVYISVESVQDENVQKLVQRGSHAVLKLASGDAAIVSGILGATDGEEVTGESVNVGGSEGGSENQSVQEGYEGDSPVPKTKSASGAQDNNRGVQIGITQNVQIGDVPVARAGHLRLVTHNQAAVFGSRGERRGLFLLSNLRRLGEFPPPGPRRFDVAGHLARIAARQGVDELPGASGRPAIDPDAKGALPAAPQSPAPAAARPAQPQPSTASFETIQRPRPRQTDELEPLETHGRINRLRQNYGFEDSYGFGHRGISRGFREYLELEAANRDMTYDDFMEWTGFNR